MKDAESDVSSLFLSWKTKLLTLLVGSVSLKAGSNH